MSESPSLAVARLRAATGAIHARLEQRIDAIERFRQPLARRDLIARFAALHAPAAAVLAPHLFDIADLDFPSCSRASLLEPIVAGPQPNAFPAPANKAEALGMLYVLEGSTLGGRFILQRLSELGADVSDLAFLDPYGGRTGERWRGFLGILERETAGDERRIADACTGASAAFEHAERVLCGTPA